MTVNLPEGIFGNPGAIFKCRAADLRRQPLPGRLPGRADHDRRQLRRQSRPTSSARRRSTTWRRSAKTNLRGSPSSCRPSTSRSSIPIEVRSESDYGLRLSINSISQTLALTSATMTVWGFPASGDHDSERFHPGDPGEPPGCPGDLDRGCIAAPFPQAGIIVQPLHRQPERLHRQNRCRSRWT